LNRISLKKISLFLLILLPFAIIIGQAPSDIIVSTISILFFIENKFFAASTYNHDLKFYA